VANSESSSSFQGSETSRVDVTFYSFADEYGLNQTEPILSVSAPSRVYGQPIVARVETSKMIGPPAGTFAIDIKADGAGRDAVMALSDDDWVDIIFVRNATPVLVMRGQIDSVQRVTSVVNGATSEVFRVAGRDFGRIFDLSTVWFDLMSDGEVAAGVSMRIFDAAGAMVGDPATTVETILAGFLREFKNVGRNLWELPRSMPLLLTENAETSSIVDNLAFFDADFINYPERYAISDMSMFTAANSSVWALASQWADLPLCELYTEVLQWSAATISPSPEFRGHNLDWVPTLPVDQRQEIHFNWPVEGLVYPQPPFGNYDNTIILDPVMAVVFRDRPFLTTTRIDSTGKAEPIDQGPWSRLYTYHVPPQHIAAKSVGRSTEERKNAFQATPRLMHDLTRGMVDWSRPLWRPDDIKRHGLRRMDVTYDWAVATSKDAIADISVLAEMYRRRLRDFHCMNHLWLSGTISLGYGRPDIRIGHKLQVSEAENDTSESQETYYVEAVRHVWTLDQGTRTTLGVTRGWRGSQTKMIEVFNNTVDKYTLPSLEDGSSSSFVIPSNLGDDDWRRLADHYPARSAKMIALFRQAAIDAGLPESWADPTTEEGSAFHEIYAHESGGYVGRPNFLYQPDRLKRYSGWLEIHDELRRGIINSRLNSDGLPSSATGLGQLLLDNVELYYPSGVNGINVANEEAIGMLRYIEDRYGLPSVAWARWQESTRLGKGKAWY